LLPFERKTERFLDTEEVTGSNPVPPIKSYVQSHLQRFLFREGARFCCMVHTHLL
jgi:hypothetical protein